MNMKDAGSGGRAAERKRKTLVMLIAATILALMGISVFASAGDTPGKWEGVDRTVVERIAKEQGREAAEPLINTEQGDLMLFLFLTAGGVGGFCAGYCYRMLTERKSDIGKKAA